ncbi:hypothetical protein FWK35_00011973 [Aphis craccivora]|uniref:Uncharacterized protein n=1 Tax=Aphis craccivora TaxID=307492 RepID=A0A6G0YA92_APHCR|nr:hypothetical protein FWK35_00011973 [Aphis craccivora]
MSRQNDIYKRPLSTLILKLKLYKPNTMS